MIRKSCSWSRLFCVSVCVADVRVGDVVGGKEGINAACDEESDEGDCCTVKGHVSCLCGCLMMMFMWVIGAVVSEGRRLCVIKGYDRGDFCTIRVANHRTVTPRHFSHCLKLDREAAIGVCVCVGATKGMSHLS